MFLKLQSRKSVLCHQHTKHVIHFACVITARISYPSFLSSLIIESFSMLVQASINKIICFLFVCQYSLFIFPYTLVLPKDFCCFNYCICPLIKLLLDG